ncbi:MAG: HAAS signaling domain-containing protein [Acidimicrobiales bacterium]
MSTSADVLDAPLVEEYRRQLEAALRRLPPSEAERLREQIDAHLRDAIARDAGDSAVREVLRRLGSPEEVVAAAVAEGAAGPLRPPRVGLGHRLRRMRRRTLAIVVVALALSGALLGWGIDYASSPSLVFDGEAGWWPAQGPATITQIGNLAQSAVPFAFGKTQGFFVVLHNPSGWSQTIVGLPPYTQSMAVSPLHIRLALFEIDHQGLPTAYRYHELPFTIPPGGYAFLREYWTTYDCTSAGVTTSTDAVVFQVRVGGLSVRRETISVDPVFALVAPPSTPKRQHCPTNVPESVVLGTGN